MTIAISKTAKLCLGALSVLCLTGMAGGRPASAQEQYNLQLRTTCKEDYQKHCADVKPGGGAIADCLMSNLEKLTPDCRAGMEAWKKSKEKS
jgi:hypothetical protein